MLLRSSKGVEIFAGERMIRIQLQRAAQMHDRFPGLIVCGERATEIGFGVGVLRTEGDGSAKVFDGLRKLIVHGECEAEIVLGIEIVRISNDLPVRDPLLFEETLQLAIRTASSKV